jgi:peptidoglycan-associated lipoprotein
MYGTRMSNLTTAAMILMLGAGCAHARVQPVARTDVNLHPAVQPAVTPPKVTVAQAPAVAQAAPVVDDSQARRDLEQAVAKLNDTNVYFAYDSARLTPDGESRLADIGAILAAHPKLAVRVEGNCDERGTEEYNIQLGQQRANEARKYLMTMGAQTDQLKTLSYGDERPVVQGHTEKAWQQNRRDHIVVAN